MSLWIVVAVVWVGAAVAGLWVFRRRRPDDQPLTDRWRADHDYDREGDRRWK